jgi:chorismate mutase
MFQNSRRDKYLLVSGPCSAETEDQMNRVAQEMKQIPGLDLFRAGVWKPRTRPDSFEGVGPEALPWVVAAGKTLGVPTAVEIANAKHAELALKAGIDVLWIGARTTVNPFAVQEIADSLAGVNIPIMVKNPVNPDLELWIGAFERLAKSGITDFAAIHRGFSVYKHPKYRNVPNWELPIALKERMPEICMINDPSHITGNRSLLLEVAQKAMDLNFDGLMIETHPTPDAAWSDSAQQLTPFALKMLLESLVLRSKVLTEPARQGLLELREKIEILDERLFDILMARMHLSEEVGLFKKEHNITILQEAHWSNLIQSKMGKAKEYGLTERFVRQIMDSIHQESIRHQVRVMNEGNESE